MGEMKKITVEVPLAALQGAQAYTGKNITETVTEALKQLAHQRACDQLLAMRGKVKLGMTWEELKELRD